MRVIFLYVSIVVLLVAIACLVALDLYLLRKVREFERKNAKLRNENIGLMKHNGKLYDENLRFKSGISANNIPEYDPW